jgi:hypothetical protein
MTGIETAFISGHIDITDEEFSIHYIPFIDKAIKNRHNIVVGDCKGTDIKAQEYISQFNYPWFWIYHMFTSPRNEVPCTALVGGFSSDEDRDKAMTLISTYDIAWVRPGRETSGTAKNIKRRNEIY